MFFNDMLVFVPMAFTLFPILWYFSVCLMLLPCWYPALKTECKFACELSGACQETTILGAYFMF